MSYISAIQHDNKVYVWERNESDERVLKDYLPPYYFYYDDPNGKYKTIYGSNVSKETCENRTQFKNATLKRLSTGDIWESDIPQEYRILSQHYYESPVPKLHVTYLDIEVDYTKERGFSKPSNPYAPINAVALFHQWKNEYVVLAVPPEPGWDSQRLKTEVEAADPGSPIPEHYNVSYIICDDEYELLLNLICELEDSDAMVGWNSDLFDIPYITQRICMVIDKQPIDLSYTETCIQKASGKIPAKYESKYNNDPNIMFSTCKAAKRLEFSTKLCQPKWRLVTTKDGKVLGHTVDFQSKLRVDYLTLYKKYEASEKQSYKLEAIADLVLVDAKTKQPTLPKIKYAGTLAELYRNNFAFFIRYNIRDCEILAEFEKKLGYVDLANQMYHMSTTLFKDVTGTLKLAEYALINYCHHTLNRVVNNSRRPKVDRQIDGALVLLPQVGMHQKFGSIDIKSLYPSTIRSLNISPETIRGQFLRDVLDFIEIKNNSSTPITLILEDVEETQITKTAAEWRIWFKSHKWAVSGYGTVFDQTNQGFVPGLLAEWYNTRTKYQKLKEEAIEAGDMNLAGYYDRLQYVYKIKLNSAYGALTNQYFRFYDIRMGESTTGTGRVILTHQCKKTSEVLDGNYDVNFPLYNTIDDALESGFSVDEAQRISLNGPIFNGLHQSECVIYGDTDSTYFKTYTDDLTQAVRIADAVAEKVNASYPDFMRESFLCNEGYDNIISASREIVSDRGIFVEKKRYILHLINVDGKPVDKMKVMGLDTKKTTLPAAIAKQINRFMERFLKGETWESVSQSVVDYKDELMKTSDLTLIGLPKGVNGIDDYTDRYQDKYVERNEKVTIPGHVSASIYYNLCRQQYNDLVSPEIMSGMKIRVFYLLGKHGKFKSIALPTDIEVVPNWFSENFNIDRDAHIARLVDNPLTNILKAVNKKPPSKQSMFVDSLLEF